MMSKWDMVRLGDVGTIITGNTPKTSDEKNYSSNDLSFIKPSDISEQGVVSLASSENFISDYARLSCRIVPRNSVLVTCIGIIGKVGVAEIEMAFNQQINAIVPDDKKCYPRFLAYAIYRAKHEMNHIANAAVVPIINKSQFSDVQIPLPPLEEQKKIADILDRASTLIEKRKAQIAKLDLFVKSQFIAMFGDPVINPMGWEIKSLQSLISNGSIMYHLDGNHGELYPKSSEFVSEGVPYIGANCINDGVVEYTNAKYLSEERANSFRKGIAINDDVLFAHNATVGPVAILKTQLPKVILSTSLTAYRCNESVLSSYYLKAYMTSTAFVRQFEADMGQTTRNQVPITKQREYNFVLPPLYTQNRFAVFVTEVEKSKAQMQQALVQQELLYKSLMQKCFNGEAI